MDDQQRTDKEREPERITQTEFGELGNCQSACIAMMLGLSLADVPNWTAMPISDNQKYAEQGKWLRARGWHILTLCPYQAIPWPPAHGFYIAGGVSPRGFRHSVIFKDGKLWHDPHPSREGIGDVQDIDILLPLPGPFARSAGTRRRDGHSALRVKDGELERFDPHPPADDVKAAAVAWERSCQVQPVLPPNAYEGFLAGASWARSATERSEEQTLLEAALCVMEQWDEGLDEQDGREYENACKDWADCLASLRAWRRLRPADRRATPK